MTWLLLATGFTGGLTLVFVARRLWRWWIGPGAVEVFFSPSGDCLQAVVREIAKARHEVLVQAYSFNVREIAEALVAAKTRGVNVTVVLDRINEEAASDLPFLVEQGLAPLLDAHHVIAPSHVVILDAQVVVTGSFTFTPRSSDNAENLVILRGHPEIAREFRQQFLEHRGHSKPVAGAVTPVRGESPQAA